MIRYLLYRVGAVFTRSYWHYFMFGLRQEMEKDDPVVLFLYGIAGGVAIGFMIGLMA